jgi:xylulokinase
MSIDTTNHSKRLYLGIDLGTSSIKAVIIDQTGNVRSTATIPLTIQHRHPNWSEQDPEEWWNATENAIERVLQSTEVDSRCVAAIGLSGQQHGAVLLDSEGQVLRPAILWNDGRSDLECKELEKRSEVREITGNLAMPGFTAPKLLWIQKHEPEIFKVMIYYFIYLPFLENF